MMDTFFIVPKRDMNAEMVMNKAPPEAAKVLALESLTTDILQQPSLSEWQKAELLSKNLQRFLSLRPRVFDDPSAALPSTPQATAATVSSPTVSATQIQMPKTPPRLPRQRRKTNKAILSAPTKSKKKQVFKPLFEEVSAEDGDAEEPISDLVDFETPGTTTPLSVKHKVGKLFNSRTTPYLLREKQAGSSWIII